MQIAVNTRLLRKNGMDGIGWFAYNTLRHIVAGNPDVTFHFFFDSTIDPEFLFADNIVPHKLFPPAKHALLNIAWSEISVKRQLKKIQPDLYFSPDGMLCLGWNGSQYGVIHDVNFMHHPEFLKYSNRIYYQRYFPKFAKKAERIGTVSAYSKKDIADSFRVDPAKIDVLYCGINSFFHPVAENVMAATRQRYCDGKEYFLFVGTLSPRKNIIGLMKAYELFRESAKQEIKLVIAGGNMYRTGELLQYKNQSKYAADIIFTGRLQDAELNNMYGSALALVFVPFFEGFGIPLIEAMQCRLPVIASNITSIPEITGDAALLVNPAHPEEIAGAMHQLAVDLNLRQELIRRGVERSQLFSWERTSQLLWEGINRCL